MPAKCLTRIVAGTLLIFVAAIGMAADEQNADEAETREASPVAEHSVESSSDDAAQDDEETSAAAEDDPDRDLSPRMKAHNRFLFLYDGERYAEASAVGLEVVSLAREEFGEKHMNVASPLVNLAIAQTKSGDLPSAEINYEESITIIEDAEGALSPRLINPLSGLGSVYNKSGQFEKGAVALERALLINHVNEGLYNFEQFKIQDGLTDSFAGMNNLEDATFYQKSQVEIHERKLGVGDPEIAIALYKLAQWYERINDTEQAMLAYRRADRLLRKTGGNVNLARVEALQGIAKVYERQGLPSSTAGALKKALAIINAQPEPDYLERAKILVALGDLYMRQGKFESSERNYSVAWEDLSKDDNYLDQRDLYFDEPVRVLGGRFSTIEFSSRSKPESRLKDGHVLVSYSVTEKGRVRDLKVIESEPVGLMDRSILATYKRSAYRPRRVDGAPATSHDRIARHDFKYAESLEKAVDVTTKEDSKSPNRDDERLEYPDRGD